MGKEPCNGSKDKTHRTSRSMERKQTIMKRITINTEILKKIQDSNEVVIQIIGTKKKDSNGINFEFDVEVTLSKMGGLKV